MWWIVAAAVVAAVVLAVGAVVWAKAQAYKRESKEWDDE